MSASEEELLEIEGIGEQIAASLTEGFFQKEDNLQLVNKLLAQGVKVSPYMETGGDKPLTGFVFLFTGGLERGSMWTTVRGPDNISMEGADSRCGWFIGTAGDKTIAGGQGVFGPPSHADKVSADPPSPEGSNNVSAARSPSSNCNN